MEPRASILGVPSEIYHNIEISDYKPFKSVLLAHGRSLFQRCQVGLRQMTKQAGKRLKPLT
jgi:hypothetical protein